MRDPLGWQEDALCAETDLEAFFPDKGGSVSDAMRVCGSCGVAARCLAYALSMPENPDGVWGGTTKRQRGKMRLEATSPPEPPDREQRIRSLHAAGWSDEQIGEVVSLTGRQVGRLRATLGLPHNFFNGKRVA